MSFAESAAAASAPPPTVGGLGSFAEWVVDKLCDNELQHTMEASGVLNSWDEGSYLSVVKTDGDGNCLAHAVMTAGQFIVRALHFSAHSVNRAPLTLVPMFASLSVRHVGQQGLTARRYFLGDELGRSQAQVPRTLHVRASTSGGHARRGLITSGCRQIFGGQGQIRASSQRDWSLLGLASLTAVSLCAVCCVLCSLPRRTMLQR